MTARRIALVAPNIARRPNNTNRLYTLGLLYLANVADRAGWRGSPIDAYFSEFDEVETVAAILADGVPDAVGFSLYSAEMAEVARRVIAEVRVRAQQPVPCVVGGHYATIAQRALLADAPEFDHVVLGEGEGPLAILLDAWTAGAEVPADATGIVSRARPVRAARRPPVNLALDTLGALDFARCHVSPGPEEFSLVTSRGCDAHCSFCVIGPHWGRYGQWRGHSAGWIVDQVERLIARGARYIQFVDDQFFGNASSVARAWDLCDLLARRRIAIPFYILARADGIVAQPALCAALAEVGLETVFMGIESASPVSLTRLNKRADPVAGERAVAILDRLEVQSVAGTIVFTPWMTPEILACELDFLERMLDLYPNFQFFGLNELDVLESTAMAPAFRNGTRGWRYDWTADDPAMQWVFRTWLELQDQLLFPAMRLASPERRLPLRRDYCRWQIAALRSVVAAAPAGRLAPGGLARLFADLSARVMSHAGAGSAATLADAVAGRNGQVAERCFG